MQTHQCLKMFDVTSAGVVARSAAEEAEERLRRQQQRQQSGSPLDEGDSDGQGE